MYEVGRLCVKIAGRDANKKCVIVEILDKTFVMIDGETRRRKVNVLHLEPLSDMLEIKKGATREDVKAAFKKINIELVDPKRKEKKERPRRIRKALLKDKTEEKAKVKKKPKKKGSFGKELKKAMEKVKPQQA